MNFKTLILGGVRSGKSRLAERLATESGLAVTYLATATAQDEEMRARIAAHRSRRPDHWHLIEEPIHLATVLEEHAVADRCLVVDCLSLWLTNLLGANDAALFGRERKSLLTVLPALAGPIILISNETNMGIMPLGELTRRYCDEAGLLHQELARCCDRVILTVAGLARVLK
ncbi:MAG: bifunctional adenosylcobinamide kinase/adenosylcobinamide-phosphate guanylyltransferase [Methylococcales bacterium]